MVYLFLHFNQQIPLHYACHSGNSNVVEILIKQPNLKVNKQDEEIFRKSEFLEFFLMIYIKHHFIVLVNPDILK